MTEPPRIARSTDDRAVRALPKPTSASRRFASAPTTPHTKKFRAAMVFLAGIGVAAVIGAITVAGGNHSTKPTQAWSNWSPQDSGTLAARDIADHVAPFYRLSAVDQLAVVTVVNLETAAQAAAVAQAQANGTNATGSGLQVAVRPSPTSSAVSLLSGNTIAYNLCGIGGKNCAIGIGTPSTDRLLLLRREALELALYTFKYVGGVENVVAILPPGHTDQTSTLSKRLPTSDAPASKPVDIAVLFVRQEVQPLLNQPLSNTFPEQFPPAVSQMASAPEAGLVDQITARGLFSEQLQQAQDGSDLIVLNPLPPQ
jgi:hypothetical protein